MIKHILALLKNRQLVAVIRRNNGNQYRTHNCNGLNLKDLGKDVTVCGWVKSTRFNKFLIIRDFYAVLQVYIPDQMADALNIKEISLESVVKVTGTLRLRPDGQDNKSLEMGSFEVECKHLEIINEAKSNIPIQLNEISRSNETMRLKYRYLDLRAKEMQSNLKLRSDFVQAVRTFLTNEKFLDIETPTLFRRTPGGAREFIVPTRIDKSFFSLTQSPQQFKQLLMVAGFDRYFQIARCYRDEELKADRQPEFTQIDLEMSFIDEADCMDLIEKLFASCWPYRSDLIVPFKRITYEDAIAMYGSDKPDVRFGFEIHRVTDFFRTYQCGISKIDATKSAVVEAFFIKIPCNVCANDQMLNVNVVEKILTGELKKNNLTNTTCLIFNKTTGNYLTKYFNENFRNAFAQSTKTEPDDLIVMLIGDCPRLDILETLGRFRVAIADHIDTENSKIKTMPRLRDPNKYEFRWIVDFPLFTYDNIKKRFESTHHPFTAPKDNQINMIYQKTNLDRILGKHYDLVLNGNEIGGGSIRIHDSKLQKFIIENVLNEDFTTLNHLIEALSFGAPPHGGIALGLDRLMALLCKTNSIRDVIAFPKSSSGKDLMSDAPTQLSQDELDFYKIKLI